MYKRAIGVLMLLNLIFLSCSVCVKEIAQNRQEVIPSFRAGTDEQVRARRERSAMGIAENAISGQRVVEVEELEENGRYVSEGDDLDILLRIVEAEAGDQGPDGKLLVANVVLNRVKCDSFPDNVTDVVFQNSQGVYQFSPVASGLIWQVEISDETREAVNCALEGQDISKGALYFAARKYADKRMMKWFDEQLTFLFEYGGHEFFR